MAQASPDRPPHAWARAQRLRARVAGPIERFLHVEAASGLVLLAATAIALAWANSPWRASYEALWHLPVTLGLGPHAATRSLHFWINDGAMTIFFFVVGLEIRREIHGGELAEPRRAALPIAAAIGGMIVPALLFRLLVADPVARQGWGVPMATDIAFAVGVLALLGPRVPPALRVLLLALAIIDDIGAILVIAVFYSSGLDVTGFLVAAVGLAGVVAFRGFGVRAPFAYVFPGAVLWWGLLRAGVHPTLAGVVLGLLTPARIWEGHEEEAPVERLQAQLHGWVAYGIMPVFALANAGVTLDARAFEHPATPSVAAGVVAGLVLGKPIGILAAAFLLVKLRLGALPRGVGWAGIGVVGAVAGIGFTMAIFIAGLAFPEASLLAGAKLGVLGASVLAAVVGLLFGRVVLPVRADADAEEGAKTASEAERSTEL